MGAAGLRRELRGDSTSGRAVCAALVAGVLLLLVWQRSPALVLQSGPAGGGAAAARVALPPGFASQGECMRARSQFTWTSNFTRAPSKVLALVAFELVPVGLQARCDWVVGSRSTDGFHGVKLPRSTAWGDVDAPPRTIFVRKDLLPAFHRHVLPCVTEPFVLLLGDTDTTVPRQTDLRYGDGPPRSVWRSLLRDPRVLHMFVENLDERPAPPLPAKVSGLPIGANGLEFNDQGKARLGERIVDIVYDHGAALTMDLDRRPLTAVDTSRVRPGPQWVDRARVVETCRGPWAPFCVVNDTTPAGKPYWELLAAHSFVLCVHGGGLDPSPKAWEALLMGSIPIIQHFAGDDAYRQLPVVFVDSWDASVLSAARLKQWRDALAPHFMEADKRAEVLRRLGSQFWWDKVEAALAGKLNALLDNTTDLSIEWRGTP